MTTYYLIESNHIGPNRKDSNGNHRPAGELFIQTRPGETNSSHEERTSGWLGTTNDVAEYAHGAFETLEAARAAAVELGYTEIAEPSDDDEHDDEIIERRVSLVDSREQWDAGDWLGSASSREQQIADLHITAASTDADLDAIENSLTAEARGEGIELHGLEGHLEELRTLAQEAGFRIALDEMAAEYGVPLEGPYAEFGAEVVRVFRDKDGWHVCDADLDDASWAPKDDGMAMRLWARRIED